MDQQTMIDLCLRHTLYTWSATGSVKPLPVARAEGVYLYGPDGQRWLDFNSQLMSVNIGHSHPKVVAAIQAQAATLLYTYPGTATEVRARLGAKLAELCPPAINTFFFTLGGAEANENAIKAVRQFTGRFKILSQYRSYHGATNATMQLTGDPRRIPNEPGAPGFVRVMGPWPYTYAWGDDEDAITAANLAHIEEIIQYEGPETIAAMFVEPVIGTNGILAPPRGWLKGLRAVLDRYGILLVCDEVMSGFGRTGRMFAFEHGDIVPDVITMAKGLTSSYLPLGAMGVRDDMAEHFRDNVFWGGLTYNSHAMCLAAALANLEVLLEEGLIDNAVAMGARMRAHMDRMQQRHPSVREGRQIGLFGIVDIQKNRKGEPLCAYNTNHPAMGALSNFFRDNGLFTFIRWGSFMCNPPLCITAEEMDEAFEIIDRGLVITDEAMDD